MAVLVSGASGFLGSQLVERLASQGRNVVAVARRAAPEALRLNSRIHWIVRDIARDGLQLKELPGIESVVHLAGATLGAGTDEDNFLRANEQTTVRLLQTLAGRTVRFVFASSQVVYGDACDLAVTEDFPLRPESSAYACSKINSENWLRWFQARHGGQFIALRLCGFIDGGGLVDYLIDRALTGNQIELYSHGMVRRDYLPSVEGVDALVAALNYSGGPGFLPVNIGSGQAVSAYDLAIAVCTQLKSSSRIELCAKSAPQGDMVFSIDRARELLGFRPRNLIDAVILHAQHRQDLAGRWANDA